MKNKMRVYCISDTHSNHRELSIPENIDLIVHSGDCTNYKDLYKNEMEFTDFIEWYASISIKYKVLIAGNHDAWSTKQYNIDKCKDLGIIYIDHEYFTIEGRLLFGSKYTPNFCNWYWNVDRSKLHEYWSVLVPNIDLLITHGPPKFILDLTHNRDGKLEYCGDMSLFKKVLEVKPKFHQFGHTHNGDNIYNQGIRVFGETTFINASCVTDGRIGRLSSEGIIIEI